MSTVDLSVIIVSWNVADLLIACLDSLTRVTRPHPTSPDLRSFGPRAQPRNLEVIVVDNDSHDDTVARIRARHSWARVIETGANLGFTGGNNRGYAASRGDYLFFLNPDTEIKAEWIDTEGDDTEGDGAATDGSALWTLFRVIDADDRIVMVGPQLRYGDGAWQSNRRRFPTLLTAFTESTWLGQALPANPWARRYHMDDLPSNVSHEVDWLVGAAIMGRRTALEAVRDPADPGPFDESFFMYSEETDLCKRLKDAGGRIVYVPDAVVLHYEGRSSEQVVAARHIRFNTSKVHYIRKHHGATAAFSLRHYLLLEYRVQLLLERTKLLLGSKPDLRRDRIAAYRQVIRSRLNG